MAASAGSPRRAVAATFPPIPLRRRLYGFGSIYGKTIRDSLRAFIVAAGLLAGVMLAITAGISARMSTQAARGEIVGLANSVGATGGIAGKPVNVGTPAGYVQWKYGPVFLWVVGPTFVSDHHGPSSVRNQASPTLDVTTATTR